MAWTGGIPPQIPVEGDRVEDLHGWHGLEVAPVLPGRSVPWKLRGLTMTTLIALILIFENRLIALILIFENRFWEFEFETLIHLLSLDDYSFPHVRIIPT